MRINKTDIGPGHPCYVIAEIGINHNGSLETALELIEAAFRAGCQAVKFQKRTVDVVYTPEELAKPRKSPFGETNGDLKRGLEFGAPEYLEIDAYCASLGIDWFASPWDEQSVDFLEEMVVCAYKVASASVTDHGLLRRIAETGKPVIMSTGMSTPQEVAFALQTLSLPEVAVLHCTSLYPCPPDRTNLLAMHRLSGTYCWMDSGARRECDVETGYSGHELGTAPTLAAVAMGAHIVERHITLDRTMFGSDQSASLEPDELKKLVSDIREIEAAMGDGVKRVYDEELPVKAKLRRVG